MAHAERLAPELQRIALQRIAQDRLVLPSTPAVAAKCMAMLREQNVNLKLISNTLERDPMLAAMVTRVANSAAHSSGMMTYGLQQAVIRLGAIRIKTILVEACARQTFDSRDKRIGEVYKRIWEHSIAVALLSRDVAGAIGNNIDPDSAYLAGLLHDVGKPVVGSFLLEAEKLLAPGRGSGWLDSDEWLRTVQETHRPIGVALAEKWAMPADITRCIRDCTDYDPTNRLSIVNVVRFANAIAKKEQIYIGAFAADDVDALVMIGRSLLGLGEEVIVKITHNLKERVKNHTC